MTIEEKLKSTILERYKSLRAFTKEIDVPYSTIDTMFKRGIGGTGISTISKICNTLEIDALALADGEIKPIERRIIENLTGEELTHIKKYRNLDEHSRKIVNFIMDMELERKPAIHEAKEDNIIRLPLSDYKASAGTGAFLFDSFPEDTIDVVLNSVTEKASECIAVKGGSMQPLYYDDDILLVKRQQYIDVGEVGIFIKGGEGYVKKKGEDRLISLNKEYKDIYPDDEVITCYGKVIGKVEDEWRR